MKKAVATKWISALRSGKYKQGRRALKYKTAKGITRHCCLGVLCELYNQDRKKQQKKQLKTETRPAHAVNAELPSGCTPYTFGSAVTVLPLSVKKWAGMDDASGEFYTEDEKLESLAELNDNGYSFKQIANIIEKNVKII